MAPRLTAVIPLHNRRDWIKQAIDSLLAQQVPLQIVVTDDGSTDGSHEVVLAGLTNTVYPDKQGEPWVCKGLWGPHELMLCRFEKARGPSFARNYCIRAAWDDTDIYCLLDSDDYYHPGKIAASLPAFAYPQVGIVYTDYETLHPDGLRIIQHKEPYSRDRLVRECIINPNSLISKDVFAKVGLFDDQLRVCEDYDLWLRATEHFMAYHVGASLVTMRVGEHSSSSTVAKEQWERCYRRVFEKLQERMRG
jgi:glycosyltransferase involved in cell wall biosynthesis